jgi:hypothetical protein
MFEQPIENSSNYRRPTGTLPPFIQESKAVKEGVKIGPIDPKNAGRTTYSSITQKQRI